MKQRASYRKSEVVWVDQGYSGKNFANAVRQVCGDGVAIGSDQTNIREF
ncbi:MAG: hypothetical protein F6K35_11120 [Okeania sp. SIO2H7]|nr:hypothetical protein [Okeania sp. SIO2H7]